MARLLALIGATLGGGAGWWIGNHIGLMSAFALSVLGTGAGMYLGRRVARDYCG